MKSINVLNRILILNLLPIEGDLLTIKTLKNLKDKLNFSEQEVKEFELKLNEKGFTWNPAKVVSVEFEFTDGETKLIVDGINEVIKNKKLTEQHLGLCDMFSIE